MCEGNTNIQQTATHGKYQPLFQHYTMTIPKEAIVGEATGLNGDVVGILANGVLLDSHKQTWAYDSCNGHSDKKHQYHYHIPPICLLESMGVTFSNSSDWWINDEGNATRDFASLFAQFPESATPSPIIGFALDGHPIYALYDETGVLQRSAVFDGDLDECNGKTDSNGVYGYYMTADPPFAPPCLKGNVGLFTYSTSDIACPKEGISNTIVEEGAIGVDVDRNSTGINGVDGGEPTTKPIESGASVVPFLVALYGVAVFVSFRAFA